jgi:diguanylate cyclase (GGDEF)-like protein/PAS domain S-box-containing protein
MNEKPLPLALNPTDYILIVDDLPDNLRILSGFLSDHGFQVRCAKSGLMALRGIEKSPPNLVLLDINMPEMDGYEVCRRLKAREQTREIPVIFLSALDDVLDKVKAFEVGGADYISKPFQVKEVLVRIQHQLALRAAKQEICQLNLELEQRVDQRTAQLTEEIKNRTQAEKLLRESEQKLESILNALEEVVWSMTVPSSDVLAGENHEFLYVNQAVERIYGYPPSSFFKNPTLRLELIHPLDRELFQQESLRLQEQGSLDLQYRILHPNGEIRWLTERRQLICDEGGTPIRVDSIISDITQKQKIEAQLRHDALHDGLTGLPNRTLFMDRVEQAIKRSQRYPNYLFAVLFIDLDRFKTINDSFGHAVGDQLLIRISRLLRSSLREIDMVARLGGDEFTILLEDLHNLAEAMSTAERLLAKLSLPVMEIEGQSLFTGASIGLVLSSTGYHDSSSLLRDADIAMYRAKSQGKGCYVVFDRKMYDQTAVVSKIERDLYKALERQEFLLYYQPIVDLQENRLHGFEALVRWNHPEQGLISPAEFIPIAEEIGLIVPLGRWVLREACRQLRDWQIQFPEIPRLKMSVNVSGREIQTPDWMDELDQILTDTGLDPNCLSLEITESFLIDRGETTLALFSQLKSRGISLSIDDFGTGYSSLSALHRFPIDTLKIDRSFINNIHVGRDSFEITRIIIALAHVLNMGVIAEGVETTRQSEILTTLGCEFVQGYLFSKPLNCQQTETLIAQFR